jgi:hypothetical protein
MKSRRTIDRRPDEKPLHSFLETESMTDQDKQNALLRAKLNQETAQMPWKELQRYYAGGMVIAVSHELDLVDVAMRIASDDKAAVTQWMSENRIAKVSDAQALAWWDADLMLWTVVVKPWILVQPPKPS